jgi:uncharacterized protein YndB with AHSA1/START domain
MLSIGAAKTAGKVMNGNELQVKMDFQIPVAVDQVWDFLINEEKMKSWLETEEFVIDIWEGGGFNFPYSFQDHQCRIIGEVTILLEKEKYGLTWWERESTGKEWLNCTTVMMDMSELDAYTHISLAHNGFQYLPPDSRESIFERYAHFWQKSGVIDRLIALIVAEHE